MKLTVLCALLLRCGALSTQTRRAALKVAAAGGAALLAGDANALEACKAGSNNCFTRTWAAPAAGVAVGDLRAALDAYPQAGQNGVDLGGFSYAVDSLNDKGYAKLEFTSGLGNFARFFNGNKPFVDDFEVQVTGATVAVRSASRVGDSDLGVNGKRMDFIAANLKEKGWAI
ncbi:hypothetical protein M885DRAFT_508912 [Pelagophyceae sp. CCMP2097]|nr:hypothetical protein M885DRAFT_508912 [Pelagophyceae sp. CCMP2097]|mmetsp:Transcript_21538/g.73036  ORF Transcript_21538/g.73036 Transcript_21538/m.73036 type:complete len:172 (+) Transcript_21538:32-547(+)|eukprot:CAMPEP_0184121638 /NCGR_PEP_ID=MMETSP0974-20121125/23075_1 /TAXON_ID=483370 /ORGANISM="non described non described, Strain CCMP2097" /LENGTH=171 /DNA_ID=CAMNT_0026424851 /DNA_START=27 /DNA_END=542 /DNA_ORIENTATION=+